MLRAHGRAMMVSCMAVLIAVVIAVQSTLAAPGLPAPKSRIDHPKTISDYIKHVVFIVEENRSFDFMFGAYATPQNGVNGVTVGRTITGALVPLTEAGNTNDNLDLGHARSSAIMGYDNGAMDGFTLVGAGRGLLTSNVVSHNNFLSYTQLKPDIQSRYWMYADHYVLADNAYSSMLGASFTNHLFTIAAQGAGAANAPDDGQSWGCDARPGTVVHMLNGTIQFPCFDEGTIETLAPELDVAGVSWKMYSPPQGQTVWNEFDAIRQIRCGDPKCQTYSQEWLDHMFLPTQFTKDLQDNQLPAVSWIIPYGTFAEHPPASICAGESWTVNILNTLMETANRKPGQGEDYYADTAVVIVWDDFGGFYDHVPPSFVDIAGYGMRAPMLVISPYADATTDPLHPHVSHTLYEFSSVIKLIEKIYGLQPLDNGHDRDANPNLSDMTDLFNFNQAPIPPLMLTPRCNVDMNNPPPTNDSMFLGDDPD